jgi:hypothetical protein
MRKNEVSSSYMQLCLHLNAEEDVYLRVPTVWDDVKKSWLGFIKTPKSQRLIHANGNDSFDLQNSFNREMRAVFQGGGAIAEELFNMFKPLAYWDER